MKNHLQRLPNKNKKNEKIYGPKSMSYQNCYSKRCSIWTILGYKLTIDEARSFEE